MTLKSSTFAEETVSSRWKKHVFSALEETGKPCRCHHVILATHVNSYACIMIKF